MQTALDQLSRRKALGLGAGALAAGGLMPPPTLAATAATDSDSAFDFTDPKENIYAFAKIWGTLGDEPVWGGHTGVFFAAIPGQRIIPLVGYVGFGSLQFKWDGDGLLYRGKDATFYTDLDTGEVIDSWKNPWTGETCEVIPYIHDKVRTRMGLTRPDHMLDTNHYGFQTNVGYANSADAQRNRIPVQKPYILPWEKLGGYYMLAWDWAMEINNPVNPEGWPYSSTGSIISPSEHFVFYTPAAELEDRDRPWSTMLAGFFRQTPWLPWMRMGRSGVDATLFARSHSRKITGTQEDIPVSVRKKLEKDYPDMLEPPTDWDMGPIGSTWGYYAKTVPPENPDYKPGS